MLKWHQWRLGTIVLLVIAIVGAGHIAYKWSTPDTVGTYFGSVSDGQQLVTIRPDGTFSQVLLRNGKVIASFRDRWRKDKDDVLFSSFRIDRQGKVDVVFFRANQKHSLIVFDEDNGKFIKRIWQKGITADSPEADIEHLR